MGGMKPREQCDQLTQPLQVTGTGEVDACNEPVEFIPVHGRHYQLTNALLNISSISIFTISSVRLASTALRSRELS